VIIRQRGRQPRVVFWNNIPAPYMVDRFNAVADRGHVDFEAWFSRRHGKGRAWAVEEGRWRFSHRYIPAIRIGERQIAMPHPVLTLGRSDVLVGFYYELAALCGMLFAMARGTRTMLSIDGVNRWSRREPWKEQIKRIVYRNVHGVFAAGPESTRHAIAYGTAPNRVFPLRHVINVGDFKDGAAAARPKRNSHRSRLGLQGATFIYVGHLAWTKGLQHLIEAFSRVQRSATGPVSLLCVGDGPDEVAIRNLCHKLQLRNVIFSGFMPPSELPVFYAVADVFVFPTLGDAYGLVVDEAMACGLPVISTDAAGEITERVVTGQNGFIVPAGNASALASAMAALVPEPQLRASMGAASAQRVMDSTPDRWAQEFEKGVQAILGS
jgi:glycosyltransferase involved in cell wall biosynthesis